MKAKARSIVETMGNALRENREGAANFFLRNQDLIPYLIEIAFEVEYKLHYKAAWILEIVFEYKLELLADYLDVFTKDIHKLNNESAIRPISKICHWVAYAKVKKMNPVFNSKLSYEHIQRIVESCFDWLIGDSKVATKAYSMETLYYFGTLIGEEYEWIHQELRLVIVQNIQTESPAYKAKAKKMLRLINNLSST